MKRTLAAVSALLVESYTTNVKAQDLRGPNNVIDADISQMVIEDDLMHLRMLVNQTKAKADKEAKKEEKEDAGEDASSEDITDGDPDEKSMAGDEEDELETQQGAPDIPEE